MKSTILIQKIRKSKPYKSGRDLQGPGLACNLLNIAGPLALQVSVGVAIPHAQLSLALLMSPCSMTPSYVMEGVTAD